MPRDFILEARHMAGGLNVSTGQRNLKLEENLETVNMVYQRDGVCKTEAGFAPPDAWAVVETGKRIDGLFTTPNFPDLFWKAVNGKIKYTNATTQQFWEADTGISLTAGADVFMTEYRGMLFYANGVENAGSVAIGTLQNSEALGSGTWELNDAHGYRFNNATDKVYCEGDEVDYTAVSTDDLTGVTNGLAHSAGAYVTQYRALTPPASGSIKASCMAVFRDTMWIAGMPDEPNVLRYSKTVSAVGTVTNVSDFSDGNNYLIGEGGAITGLLSTRDRIYVFTKDKTFYVGITISSSGTEVFSPDRLFTRNHGSPNPFCCVEMGDVVVFFTGKRLIRIGYEPESEQLLPDEQFDMDVVPILALADEDQSNARLTYNPDTKILRLTFTVNSIQKTLKYDNVQKKFLGLDDMDVSHWLTYKGGTWLGYTNEDTVAKIGSSLDDGDYEKKHVLLTGIYDNKSRITKRFIRGHVEGLIATGTEINFNVSVNGRNVGGNRVISDTHADLSAPSGSVGNTVIGSSVIGSGDASSTSLYRFRYPFLISSIGEDIQLKFSSFSSGAAWGVEKFRIQGITYDGLPYLQY